MHQQGLLHAHCNIVRHGQDGVSGKLCTDPRQIELLLAAFRPSAALLTQSKRMLRAAAVAGGAAVQLPDCMIDKPVIKRTHRIVERKASWRTASNHTPRQPRAPLWRSRSYSCDEHAKQLQVLFVERPLLARQPPPTTTTISPTQSPHATRPGQTNSATPPNPSTTICRYFARW